MQEINERASKVQAFKNELKSYHQLQRDYKYYAGQCIYFQNKLYGVGSPDLTGVHTSYDPHKVDPRYAWWDKLDYFNQQAKITLGRITNIEKVMSLLSEEDNKLITAVYLKGKTYEELWDPFTGVSVRMMKYQVDTAIWEALSYVEEEKKDND